MMCTESKEWTHRWWRPKHFNKESFSYKETCKECKNSVNQCVIKGLGPAIEEDSKKEAKYC